MLQRIYTRVSKPTARYSDRGSPAEHCSACRFFMSGGDCARVLGRVLPQGWCKYFSREAVQRWNPLWPMEGIPAPPGATLDLSFLTSGVLDPRITFTRASTATYFDATGTMQTAVINAPRWDYNPATLALRGLLIEQASTNLLLNSATLGTQSVAVTAQAYTLSFYGTGTITKTGAATGALAGTGPQRVSQVFTPTAGTLTLTVAGSVQNAQLETGASPTSYIPTAGASATRAVDVAGMPAAPWYVAGPSSLFAEFFLPGPFPAPALTVREVCSLNDGSASNRLVLRGLIVAANNAVFYSSITGASTVSASLGTPAADTVSKMAGVWDGVTPRAALNGGGIVSYSSALPGSINTLTFGINAPGQAGVLNGHLRRVSYWPRALTNAELQQVTT